MKDNYMKSIMENKNKLQKFLATGAEIAGAAVGGAFGLMAGPEIALGGSVVGVLVSRGLTEVSNRYLSRREQVRISAAASLTIIGINQKLQNGQQIREDDFFDANDLNRSKAEELFEGILIKCKNEYEEKKIQYMSKLFENVAFDPSIKPDNANLILNTCQQLTYRQLVLIAFIGQNENNKFKLRDNDYEGEYHSLHGTVQFLLQDLTYLYNLGIVRRIDDWSVLNLLEISPAKIGLSKIGEGYFKTLNLFTMPESEFDFLPLLR